MSTVFISAGHYPEKPGACFGDFCEFQEAMSWAVVLTDKLLRESITAQLVPTGFLQQKVDFINGGGPLLAVEIHFNSFKVWEDANKDGIITSNELHSAGSGSETLFFPGSMRGRALAESVQRNLAKVFPPNRGIKEGWYKMNKKFGPDYFLERTRCPAVIVEPEFIHKKNLIQSNREAGCQAIMEGIIEMLDND